ncbi:uncharacterized protein B0I36DRAFT_379350 [Microdochium trichocladiopsis]|uniref:HECT domain-containing protein n=1 Tax=Microdochium trichocladiopsis TaxID=1682393 RepID=A0A9P9BZQ4_9PEZI|nr:uncharacterized protein B0I36DRAFT_379350 [Microdochium trichocladiopsis]KAH7040364.1 hypothetical protein B0I36DRAFT_379350 [Microdochium trichocladiopsis]
MTPEATGPSEGRHGQAARLEMETMAALWEEVPFPRLPPDAPRELRELLVNIENPRKVYTIHRASRRHHLHVLVEKFILQLRYGCGYAACPTSSCFSCRRRLSGKAPIRRYSPASARTLAVYLASQDNPELYLCPYLSPVTEPSDAAKPLLFAPRHRSRGPDSLARPGKHTMHAKNPTALGEPSTRGSPRTPTETARHSHESEDTDTDEEQLEQPNGRAVVPRRRSLNESVPQMGERTPTTGVRLAETYTSKDYRSFAANMFGTVAFKMIEWLTPTTFDSLAQRSSDVSRKTVASPARGTPDENNAESIMVPQKTTLASNKPNNESSGRVTNSEAKPPTTASRRSSNARIRTHANGKPHTRLDSVDGSLPYETKITSPTRPQAPELHRKSLVRSPSAISRGSATIPAEEAYEAQSDEESELGTNDTKTVIIGSGSTGKSSSTSSELLDTPDETSMSGLSVDHEGLPELDSFLPQTLSHITPQAVDFLCDVLQTDSTGEKHLLEPATIHIGDISRPSGRKSLRRRQRSCASPYPQDLRLEWKLFIEQAIFSTLSEPRALLSSFTTAEGLIDSQSLWYCMLRLTRAAPSLVFDSLWHALACVFRTPHPAISSLTAGEVAAAETFSNQEAGQLMAICFHALVAAAPLVSDYRQLADMSRIRSHGMTLAGGAMLAQQSTSLCLQYEDVFTDDLALRLARRLLAAIPARRLFDFRSVSGAENLASCDMPKDVFDVVLAHIENSSAPLLEFSKNERILHEKRVPILLLDWARAVMLQDWNGEAEVDGDGPFGGALALIEAMYRKRQELLLGDVHFRSEYFGERLDCIKMPVSWLHFEPSRKVAHLLDYPYIFNTASLVSYFRAINFSRMSRSYEESTSLRSRIGAVIAPESLVTDPHHKNILQDLLKVPSTRYLILDIGRRDVLRDAFDQLWRRESRELMRPLKVHLGEDAGEEGFDSGGVQQEFFRLAIAEALNPDYGAFMVDDRTRMTWFQPSGLQPTWKYELIGLLVSLAVYNGLTLPITFPKALYQKLLGEPVTELHHIADGWPDLANGLTNLLEWNEKDGAIEDIFVLTYEFSTSMFGQPVSRVMDSGDGDAWPQFSVGHDETSLSSNNPADAPMVTGDNRQAYVDDYIRYLTDVSVQPQFEAFARGFRTCLQPKSLSLLTPSLLQSIVEGTQEIDISELRRAARYVGWDVSHRTVRDFWSIVKKFDDRMRRKLLEFVTASDRVPVGGVGNIQFIIQKNGEEEGEGGHLPTAYTCYGTLLLPEYPSRDVLKERLCMALENAQGFGFA